MKKIFGGYFLLAVLFAVSIFLLPQKAHAGLLIDQTVNGTEATGLVSGNTFTSTVVSTTAPNEVILGIIGVNPTDPAGGAPVISGVTGGGLTWSRVASSNAHDGSASVWYAVATSTLSNVTFTATVSSTVCTGADVCEALFNIITLSGVNTSTPIGATSTSGSAAGTPSSSLTTTVAGSWVLGVLFNWSNGTAPTVPAGQTAFGGFSSVSSAYYWGQRQNATTTNSGTTVTINDTAPTGIDYSEAIVEVVPATTSSGGISLVQQATSTTGTASSISKAFPNNVTAGDLIVVIVDSDSNPTFSTSTDSLNNTYKTAIKQANGPAAGDQMSIFYAENVSGGADTINVSTTGSSANGLTILEYSGVATSNSLDGAASSTGTSSATTNSGNITTTGTNDVLIGAEMDDFIGTQSYTSRNGFTNRASVLSNSNQDLGVQDRIATSSLTVSSSFSISSSNWLQTIVAFKAASPAGGSSGNTAGYAWGDKLSWTNFGTSQGNVNVVTTTVTGYAWSQNFGWINLAPSGSGVLNDGLGNLTGYAWSQNAGYINFGGVTISSTGTFQGIASGTIASSLNFGCTQCLVSTTWRASAANPLSVINTTLNGAASIVLIPSSTASVNVATTIDDTNGCSAITGGTTTIMLYRSGVGSSSCISTPNNRNCYVLTAFTASSTCSSGSQNATTTFAVQYFADATDASSSFASQNWIATVNFKDSSANTASQDSIGQELLTLTALNVTTSSINYGTVNPGANTGAVNRNTTIQNVGNSSETLQISGTALALGAVTIATSSQHYATSTFTFGGAEQLLNGSPTTVTGFSLTSPTSTGPVSSTVFWGVSIPSNQASGTYTGTVTFISLFAP